MKPTAATTPVITMAGITLLTIGLALPGLGKEVEGQVTLLVLRRVLTVQLKVRSVSLSEGVTELLML